MSSFPQHVDNIQNLKAMGFDISDHIEYGEVTIDSWDYDVLVDILGEVITEMQNQKFKVKTEKQ